MKLCLVAVLAVLATMTCFTHAREEFQGLQINDNNFDEITKAHSGVMMVAFYGPRCGHCHRLIPNWNKFVALAKEEKLSVMFGKVDASANPTLLNRFKARPWPTVLLLDTRGEEVQHIKHKRSRGLAGSDGVDQLQQFVLDKFPEVRASHDEL